jgi:hypothetical protein
MMLHPASKGINILNRDKANAHAWVRIQSLKNISAPWDAVYIINAVLLAVVQDSQISLAGHYYFLNFWFHKRWGIYWPADWPLVSQVFWFVELGRETPFPTKTKRLACAKTGQKLKSRLPYITCSLSARDLFIALMICISETSSTSMWLHGATSQKTLSFIIKSDLITTLIFITAIFELYFMHSYFNRCFL